MPRNQGRKEMTTNHKLEQILIDMPVIVTNDNLAGTLCLVQRGSSMGVATHRFLVILDYGGENNSSRTPKPGEVWTYSSYTLGTDRFMNKMVLEKNLNKTHLVICLKKRITPLTEWSIYLKTRTFDGKPINLLSEILRNAPRFDRPGGTRGHRGGYRRGVKVGELWLTQEASEALSVSLGKKPKKGERMKYLSNLILEAVGGSKKFNSTT